MIPEEYLERARELLNERALDPRTVERTLRQEGASRKQAMTAISIARRVGDEKQERGTKDSIARQAFAAVAFWFVAWAVLATAAALV